MATTNIYALKQVSRRVKKAGGGQSVKAKPKCWGKEDSKHLDCCTSSSPKCRWRRAPTRCYCMAYPFPHRIGSGLCGNRDAQNEQAYGVSKITPKPIGKGMSEFRWWRTRLAVVRVLGIENGNTIIYPDVAALCRAWLEGLESPSAELMATSDPPDVLRRQAPGLRAAVEALLPTLAEWEGSVLGTALLEHVQGLLAGTVKRPALRNARRLAKVPAHPYEFKTPAATGTDDIVPF